MPACYYLKKNIVIEPLIARYRASSYLVSPCTAPRFLRYLIKRLLSSFVKSPRMHELALKNKAMQGGPFVGLEDDHLERAKQLFQYQINNISDLLELADAQDKLWKLLGDLDGEQLDDYLEYVPPEIKGFVELYYERSGHASYRMIENLLYQSSYYRQDLQEILMYPVYSDEREFALTTPHITSDNRIFLTLPFSSCVVDKLAKSRITPISDLKKLAEECNIKVSDMDLFKLFFEESKDVSRCKYNHNKMEQIRYYGHACVEINSHKTTVMIDPLLSYDIPSNNDERLTFHDLPAYLDAIIITHLHLDHFCIETLLQIRHKVGVVIIPATNGGTCIDPSAKCILLALGFKNVVALEALEEYTVGDIVITAFPFQGEHGCLDITSKSTFKINTPQNSFLFMADMRTKNKSLLDKVAKRLGKIDTLFLGMECEGAPVSWVYGCLLDQKIERKHDQERRLNGSDAELAYQIVTTFKPSKVRVYALGREPWLSHIMKVDISDDSIVQSEINKFTQQCEAINVDIKTMYLNYSDYYFGNVAKEVYPHNQGDRHERDAYI